MDRLKKIVFLLAISCALISTGTLTASAVRRSHAYNTSTSVFIGSVVNDTGVPQLLSCNTRPTEGKSGAYVEIMTSDGYRVAAKKALMRN